MRLDHRLVDHSMGRLRQHVTSAHENSGFAHVPADIGATHPGATTDYMVCFEVFDRFARAWRAIMANSRDQLLERVRDDIDAIEEFVKRANIPLD